MPHAALHEPEELLQAPGQQPQWPALAPEPTVAEPAMPELSQVLDDPAAAGAHAARGTWWSPAVALILAMTALAWQLMGFYARELLPGRQSAGEPLDRFDSIIDTVPLIGEQIAVAVGMALAVGALALLLVGLRRQLREPVLQGAIVLLAIVALAAPLLLPSLFLP